MHVVLVNPQIPQNTGSIARSCAATRTPLHIILPIPFEISEKQVRRAGLDYWPYVDLQLHESWEDFLTKTAPQNLWFFTTKTTQPYYSVSYHTDDFLVFGSETKGLGATFLSQCSQEQLVTIPMEVPEVRSLNLSNTVSIALFEAQRQISASKL